MRRAPKGPRLAFKQGQATRMCAGNDELNWADPQLISVSTQREKGTGTSERRTRHSVTPSFRSTSSSITCDARHGVARKGLATAAPTKYAQRTWAKQPQSIYFLHQHLVHAWATLLINILFTPELSDPFSHICHLMIHLATVCRDARYSSTTSTSDPVLGGCTDAKVVKFGCRISTPPIP